MNPLKLMKRTVIRDGAMLSAGVFELRQLTVGLRDRESAQRRRTQDVLGRLVYDERKTTGDQRWIITGLKSRLVRRVAAQGSRWCLLGPDQS